ncbi:MAG: hypothetical protein HKN41_11055, partial [Ilumatobacter sp.]|nr:hypothetical protein [Ilumatobacter sp.]
VDLEEVSTRSVFEVEGQFDLVVANILAPALVAMADQLRRLTAPNGRLIVSGLLAGAEAVVVDALAPMRVVEREQLDGWSAIVFAQQGQDG